MELIGGLFLLMLVQWIQVEGDTTYRQLHVRPGRHVCLSEAVETRPIPVRETYKKAVYTPRHRNCSHHLTSCPQYDVTYVTATKTVFHLQKSKSFTQDCCPGWTTKQKREKGCMQPVCKSGCGDLGRCIQPGVCQCPKGFQGENCDIDIDECNSNDHGCHQFCTNTAGSYLCACQEGFTLAVDGKTCIFCYTCSKEYVTMQEELKQIRRELRESRDSCENVKQRTTAIEDKMNNMTVQSLASENIWRKNLTEMGRKYDELEALFTKFKDILSTTTETLSVSRTAGTAPTTHSTPGTSTATIDEPAERKTLSTQPSASTTTAAPSTHSDTTPSLIPASTSREKDPYSLPFFLYDRFASLSEQIGLLEEKIGLCDCKERPNKRKGTQRSTEA